MRAPNRNPLNPACWQADGVEGAGAATWDRCALKRTRLPREVRLRIAGQIEAARCALLAHARATDSPDPRAVEAADWLDMATLALASPAPGSEPGGGA